MFATIDNTVTLPGYTRADAAVYGQLTKQVRLQLNVENVFDKRYYVGKKRQLSQRRDRATDAHLHVTHAADAGQELEAPREPVRQEQIATGEHLDRRGIEPRNDRPERL